jgi:enoyl-CoA hydratase/carnithine racemase
VGVEKAIEMCVSGRPIAEDAKRSGLIDQVIEGDLTTGAVAFARTSFRRGAPHPEPATEPTNWGQLNRTRRLRKAARWRETRGAIKRRRCGRRGHRSGDASIRRGAGARDPLVRRWIRRGRLHAFSLSEPRG